MKKLAALATVPALMMAAAIPAFAEQHSDEASVFGSQNTEQSQEATIGQYAGGDGAQQSATVELGAQVAGQAQYDSGDLSVEQSQEAAVAQYAEGDGARQEATVDFGDQVAVREQYAGSADASGSEED